MALYKTTYQLDEAYNLGDKDFLEVAQEDGKVRRINIANVVKSLLLSMKQDIEHLQNGLDDFIGTIQIFSSNTIPQGYLLCNGGEYLKTDYADLYKKIGDTFGNTSLGYKAPSTNNHFRVPDLLDQFVRNTDGSRALGTKQTDTMQKITGYFGIRSADSDYSIAGNPIGGAFSQQRISTTNGSLVAGGGEKNNFQINFDSSRETRISNETRPKNITLIFGIKAK